MATSPVSSKTSTTKDSCRRCRDIGLPKIFAGNISFEHAEFVCDLDASVDQLEASDCSLCQLLASMAPSDLDDDGSARVKNCHLRAFSMGRIFPTLSPTSPLNLPGSGDTTLLAVLRSDFADYSWSQYNPSFHKTVRSLEETGLLFPYQGKLRPPHFDVREISAGEFDIMFARKHLDYCRINHGDACSLREVEYFYRVIDCHAMTIITAPSGCKYVALSYVWGQQPSSSSPPAINDHLAQPLLTNAPKVILDAIEVAKALDLQYLWVDRYCINQSDLSDKHSQIGQMDMIYANAQVTIIAATENGPEHGLPGVRGTARNSQPHLRQGDRAYISTLPHLRSAINNSKWATRGWTYQEGLLSARRIIFTQHQVYFECNSMYCAEAVILPLDAMHGKGRERFNPLFPPGAFNWEITVKESRRIISYIHEFSRRELTFPSDALNAMQGIFSHFEKAKAPVYQMMGVVIPSPAAMLEYSRGPPHPQWSPANSLAMGLTWYWKKPGRRRKGFPSWSWAGWEGEVSGKLWLMSSWATPQIECEVSIENDSGALLQFPPFEELPG
ncbi:uncharacterized protein BP5553_00194 [Venustampulla echinocandica]|uniref:Heterokaryon incompatibility domain-containing protein n=1 Tax=Venustampulla echinocandica TaxID=2656787 RepID=A0A370TXF3_9HELO|nr:uncharacterized protein BP5553_00194 [Venustampulla echinocandica]RDL40215.1 hypothetical protein BP5553_00194 [Venustampulla echinocandica]